MSGAHAKAQLRKVDVLGVGVQLLEAPSVWKGQGHRDEKLEPAQFAYNFAFCFGKIRRAGPRKYDGRAFVINRLRAKE